MKKKTAKEIAPLEDTLDFPGSPVFKNPPAGSKEDPMEPINKKHTHSLWKTVLPRALLLICMTLAQP